jgi:glycosyltransferase involved in cell wall biosynthesis
VSFLEDCLKRRNEKSDLELLTMKLPLVTFVIPVFDRTTQLIRAVASVLNQTYTNIEVILVLDGSPEPTRQVVKMLSSDSRVRYYEFMDNSGTASRGRNLGIQKSLGEYVAFLDSDDISEINRLIYSLPSLVRGSSDVVYGGYRILNSRKYVDASLSGAVISPQLNMRMLKRFCVPCQSTVIVRKDFFKKVGLFKTEIRYREDHEMWLRLLHAGARFKAIPHILAQIELHETNNELNFKHESELWLDKILEDFKNKGPSFF